MEHKYKVVHLSYSRSVHAAANTSSYLPLRGEHIAEHSKKHTIANTPIEHAARGFAAGVTDRSTKMGLWVSCMEHEFHVS